MATPTSGLLTFTATATLGAVYSTLLPSVAPKGLPSVANILNDHSDPTEINPNDPIVLFIIQLFVIIGFSRFLGLFLTPIRQPRVIGEVLGGIILGPTAFGRIPGFTEHIFPHASLTYLNLVATLGLIFFLFLVGLEVDFALFKRNFRSAVSVASAGLALPFALGCAVSVGLYKEFIDSSIKQGVFLLFIGTSMSITAFPVLARILTELNLLGDRVGIIVLSAGVANDVIGWVLLALTVALSQAGSGLVVLYVILCTIGWVLILFFVVRPLFSLIARKSGSLDGHGPSQSMVCFSLMICLASAWVTEEIGVNAIFGGFCAGLIMPRKNGFQTHLAEKIEDLVLSVFIPIYFATSGLKTNLALLNSGIIWAWTVCVIVVSFFGKFVGASSAAKLCGFNLRESCAIGSLMSAKGLIELIVLNVGLSSGVITQTVFSIFVLEAVLLTFLATPLTLAFYPARIRTPASAGPLPPSPQDEKSTASESPSSLAPAPHRLAPLPRFLVVLDQIENLGALMVFAKLIAAGPRSTLAKDGGAIDQGAGTVASEDRLLTASQDVAPQSSATSPRLSSTSSRDIPPTVDSIRLIDLNDRTSSLMQASEWEATLRARDPLLNLFSTFCSLHGLQRGRDDFKVAPKSAWASTIASAVGMDGAKQMVVVPWSLGRDDADGGMTSPSVSRSTNPLESLFARSPFSLGDPAPTYANLTREIFSTTSSDVGLLIDRPAVSRNHAAPDGLVHLFLPFHGGPDDRTCLALVQRLVSGNAGVSATIVRLIKEGEPTEDDRVLGLGPVSTSESVPTNDKADGSAYLTIGGGGGTRAGDTLYPGAGEDSLVSSTADEVAFASLVAHPRLTFRSHHTFHPLQSSTALSAGLSEEHSAKRLINVLGRGRWNGSSHRAEMAAVLERASMDGTLGLAKSGEVRRCLGEVGTACLLAGGGEGLWIVQSGNVKGERRREV